MRTSVLAIATIVAALAGGTGLAAAQPAPPAPAGPPGPAAVPPAGPPAVLPAGPSPPSAQAPAMAPPGLASFGPPSQYEAPPPVRPVQVSGELDEGTALALSLGMTLASSAVLVVGVASNSGEAAGIGLLGTFLGPSAGHWYRGSILTAGMGLRALGAIGTFVGLVSALSDCDDSCNLGNGAPLMIGGMLTYVGGAIYDIATAPLEVRKHNQRLRELSLAPLVAPHSAGLALGVRF